MSVIPISIARVPTLLSSQLITSNVARTNLGLLELQNQISTGKRVNQTSDDPVAASGITVLNNRLAYANQQGTNLTHASSVLNGLDTAISGMQDLVRQAQSIASSQIDSDPTTRAQQATVIDSIINSIYNSANGQVDGVHYFGGSTPNDPPLTQFNGGYRYTARGSGLNTDLGPGVDVPITIGGSNAVGETSARLRSTIDFNPNLTGSTKLSDLTGARGLGVAPGVVRFSFGSGPVAEVDLTQAQTAQDVITRLNAAIQKYQTDNSVTVLGPGGITTSGGALSIDVAAGGSLAFTDVTGGTTAADLGLTTAPFTPSAATGQDLDPKLTLQTPLGAISSLTLPLGSIRLRFSGTAGGGGATVRDIDLSSATNVDQVRNLIESTNLGVRVTVSANGKGLDLSNEVSGRTLSVEDVPGSGPTAAGNTATLLGIRSFSANTALADFNGGRGVQIVDGRSDPVTGTVTRALNTDLRITLGNGNSFDVDLRPQDTTNVQSVINRINSEAAAAVAAGQIPAGSFNATITNAGNGFALQDLTSLGPITVQSLNNSPAADQLGLAGGTYDPTSATFIAQDRTGVRVNNLLSDLIDLRDALSSNDRSGITVAGERLGTSSDRLIAANGLVGTYGQRVETAKNNLESQKLVDTSTKSNLQDLDFTEASVRFSQLQTQLTASLQAAGSISRKSLLDFLQ